MRHILKIVTRQLLRSLLNISIIEYSPIWRGSLSRQRIYNVILSPLVGKSCRFCGTNFRSVYYGMLSVRLLGSPHPQPLSLVLLDEFETENIFINCQSEGLKILTVESGLDRKKTPGTKTICLHYKQSPPSSPLNI